MIESPCVAVCHMIPDTDLCAGCGRYVAEIQSWSRMTDDEKLAVLDRIKLDKKIADEARLDSFWAKIWRRRTT